MEKTLKSNKSPLPQRIVYLSLVLVLGIVFGLVAQDFLSFIIASGRLMPLEDIGRDYLVGVITSVILGFSILFWPISKIHKQDLILVWIIRSILTIGLLILFESSHPQDSYWYVYDAINGTKYSWQELYRGGYFMVTLLTGLNHMIPDSYHGSKVVFSMMGMVACYLFYKCAVLLLGRENRKAFYFISLFPSLLFWSSLVDKGTIIILGMSIYAYGTIGWYKTKKTTYFVSIFSGILIMSLIRLWMGAIVAFPLIILFLMSDIKILKKITLILGSITILFFLGKQFTLNNRIDSLDAAFKFLEFKTTAWSYSSGSGQTVKFQIKTWNDIFSFLPLGMFTALFRPLPWELSSLMGILAGFENIFLIILLFIASLKIRCKNITNPLLLWLILLIAVWAGFFSFISYQNFGTAIRYKAQILPIFLLLIVYLTKIKPSSTPISKNS
jgi:hypothetical protein